MNSELIMKIFAILFISVIVISIVIDLAKRR